MKRIISFFMAVIMCSVTIFAGSGDPNVDGGGGGMGDGTGSNVWHVGDDGVRVTIIRDKDNTPVGTSINISNKNHDIRFHGGANSKIAYKNGKGFTLKSKETFEESVVSTPMPPIISPSGANNIAAVKQYFKDKNTIQYLATQLGFDYDRLTGGDYKLLIEPIAYFTYSNFVYALTATEAALYNGQTSGDLRQKMYDLTHQNLPLAMFLETADLGFPAWSGGSRHVSDGEIISSLGLGIIRFKDAGQDKPPISGEGLEYRCNTDVYTSCWLYNDTSEGISPDDDAVATIQIGDKSYTTRFVIPPNEGTLIYAKWHTPSYSTNVPITISASDGARAEFNTATAIVSELVENTPPNPRGRDLNEGFTVPDLPQGKQQLSRSWNEWLPYWEPKLEWEENLVYEESHEWVPQLWRNPDSLSQTSSVPVTGWIFEEGYNEDTSKWVDKGEWVDNGEWKYNYRTHSASLQFSATISPAISCETATKTGANEWQIKSGYGINMTGRGQVSGIETTSIQNAVTIFPEFNYKDYFRVMVKEYNNDFIFTKNKYSYAGTNAHFTPIWYPRQRNRYAPIVWAFDVWCPAGQLYAYDSDTLFIQGDVYDDWNIRPVFNDAGE